MQNHCTYSGISVSYCPIVHCNTAYTGTLHYGYSPKHSNVGTETAPIPHDCILLSKCQVHLRIQQRVVDHMNHQVLVVRKTREEQVGRHMGH